jgi:hypothetical protein
VTEFVSSSQFVTSSSAIERRTEMREFVSSSPRIGDELLTHSLLRSFRWVQFVSSSKDHADG